MSDHTTPPTRDEPLGALVAQLSQQTSELVRSELRLAQAEMTVKGKRAALGLGMFGGAGLLAFFGLGVLITAAVLGLAEALPGWLSALIVAVVLFAIAGVVALAGKKNVTEATPAKPEQAIVGIKDDFTTVKGGNA